MRVLVTGGAGFIGSHLVRTLVDRGHEVVVYDDMSTGSIGSLPLADIELVIGDIRDSEALHYASAGATAIVHLAAIASVAESVERPRHVYDVNVGGTLNVLEVARRGGAHVVLASSAAVYGQPSAVPIREDVAPAPLSPYGASKAAAETYTLSYAAAYGLPVLALRLFNVYGPGQVPGCAYSAVVPALIAAVRSGRPLPVEGDGEQRRDFVYVADVADVVADAVERRVCAAGPVNVGSGVGRSINALGRLASGLSGREFTAAHRPARAGDIRDSVADITRLRQLLLFKPTSLKAGLANTYRLTDTTETAMASA